MMIMMEMPTFPTDQTVVVDETIRVTGVSNQLRERLDMKKSQLHFQSHDFNSGKGSSQAQQHPNLIASHSPLLEYTPEGHLQSDQINLLNSSDRNRI